jgi:hypothetical protein
MGYSSRHRLVIQPLALCALHRRQRALAVVHFARVPPEVELTEVAMQVLFTDCVVNSPQSFYSMLQKAVVTAKSSIRGIPKPPDALPAHRDDDARYTPKNRYSGI